MTEPHLEVVQHRLLGCPLRAIELSFFGREPAERVQDAGVRRRDLGRQVELGERSRIYAIDVGSPWTPQKLGAGWPIERDARTGAEGGPAGAVGVARVGAALDRYLSNPETLVLSHLFFRLWGRVPQSA